MEPIDLWIVDSYALVFAGLLLLCGALGDRYGRRNALFLGFAIFAGASVLAAYSDSPAQLIAFRGTMGIGAALIMPATLSTLTVRRRSSRRPDARSANSGKGHWLQSGAINAVNGSKSPSLRQQSYP